MKKSLLGIVVIVFSIFGSFTITQTALGYFFGGRIINTEAPEITTAEAAGYTCEMQGGSTIYVWSLMGVNSYFIPNYAHQATENTIAPDQEILGIYEGETNIVCTRDEQNRVTSQTNIILPNISYFGTSAR